ncbi:MAG: class I SAM-dependent methyltransferase [Gaiellaceae bacterium]
MARYDGLADWYDAFTRDEGSAWMRVTEELLVALVGSGPGRCLDLGCGTGAFVPALADQGWAVVGVDLSDDQLRIARSRVGEIADELVQADASALPFEDESFDAVVAVLVYTDIDRYDLALQEAARVLRPGGRFVHVGTHPCFVSPVARSEPGGRLHLFSGYHESRLVFDSPAYARGREGLRARAGSWQVPLAALLNAVAGSGLRLERAIESPDDPPGLLALSAMRHE